MYRKLTWTTVPSCTFDLQISSWSAIHVFAYRCLFLTFSEIYFFKFPLFLYLCFEFLFLKFLLPNLLFLNFYLLTNICSSYMLYVFNEWILAKLFTKFLKPGIEASKASLEQFLNESTFDFLEIKFFCEFEVQKLKLCRIPMHNLLWDVSDFYQLESLASLMISTKNHFKSLESK